MVLKLNAKARPLVLGYQVIYFIYFYLFISVKRKSAHRKRRKKKKHTHKKKVYSHAITRLSCLILRVYDN